jgi:thymidylate synthase
MSTHDVTYHNLVEKVLLHGTKKKDRTGTGTMSLHNVHCTYDLQEGFPLFTTKKVYWNGVMDEMLFFLQKPKYKDIWQQAPEMFLEDMPERSKQIWAPWAKPDGSLGRIYGAQWRAYGPMPDGSYLDQISELIHDIKHNPHSRRMIVTAWAPQDRHNQALPACHTFFQVMVRDQYLDLQLYQRSNDLGLGLAFNVAGYSLLMTVLASITDLKPGVLGHCIGDAHVYLDHVDALKEQLSRPTNKPAPTLNLKRKLTDIDSITTEDFYLVGYDPYPAIKMRVSV